MRKIVVFLMAAFLVCSINGFSVGIAQKTAPRAKTEQNREKQIKAKVKHREPRSGKRIQKPKKNHRPGSTKKGNKVFD